MEFEGRPDVGSDIAPKGSQRFELKYGFDIGAGAQYAAQLTYKIEHTNAKLEIEIWTTAYVNGSTCKVVPASAGTCSVGPIGGTAMTVIDQARRTGQAL
jgi:hypothetical protein